MLSDNKDGILASEAEVKRATAAWAASLGSVAAELKVVSGTTENEFLSIGGRLQEFYQRAGGISSVATELVGEVAGPQVGTAMNELQTILDEMAHYVNHAQKETDLSAETLNEVIALLEQVSAPLAGFKKINKVLRMLGISTKIESARLGQSAAGFDTLASDVGQLSIQVHEKAAIVLSRKLDLEGAIRQTLSGVLTAGAQQHDLVLGILDRTRTSLAALTEVNSRCGTAATGISSSSDEVSRNIGEVVMSMQAHDIVRQQVEHVEEALRELQSGLNGGAPDLDEIASVCRLQIAQLKHASSEFGAAVSTIVGSLHEIARKESGLTRETGCMAGIADEAGSGFFSGMQKDLSIVTSALTESSQANRRLCEAMGSVAETVREIGTLVADIETLGEEIKLIALNAQIKSAYTGDEGAALGVLAEAIQRLSVDAIDHTGAVSNALGGIRTVTERLNHGMTEETSALDEEVQRMVDTLLALLGTLRQVNETLRDSLSRMDAEVQDLSEEIEQVTAGITVHETTTRVLGEAIRRLEEIVADAQRIQPGAGQGVNLDELASRYTMHSERSIHSSVLGGGIPAAAGPASGGGEFDDNIELF